MLALDEINANGGLLGKKVRVITEDNQSKPEESVTAVLKLIKQDQVSAVVGEVASSRTLAAAPTCQGNGIPLLSPASTNPKVTQVGDYIFRACFIDPFQGSTMAKFAVERLGAKRIAILTDTKNDYSVGLTQFFRETARKLGAEIVAEESYSEGDIEFKAQLTAIKADNPDVLFVPGYYTECALIARQARELGLTVPLLGGDGWDSPKTVEIGGKAVEGVYITNHYSAEDQRPEVQKFIADYRAEVRRQDARRDGRAGLRRHEADGRRDPARRLDRRREDPRRAGGDARLPGGQRPHHHRRRSQRAQGHRRAADARRAVSLRRVDRARTRLSRAVLDQLAQQLVNGLAWGSIYALIALGYTMVYGVLRLINFAHGDVYMVGAMCAFYFAHGLGYAAAPSLVGFGLVMLLAMIACAVLGAVIERVAYRPLRRQPRAAMLTTAIGVSMLLEYGGQLVFGPDPKFFPQLIESQPVVRTRAGR